MENKHSHKRLIQGKVVRKIGARSIVILVEKKVMHKKYRKIVRHFKKYIVDDEASQSQVGDVVSAVECRPLSKRKAFAFKEILVKGV